MKDNQHEQLFTELMGNVEVQELDNETAAAIQGGAALEVFRDINLRQRVGSFNSYTAQVRANDQISSVRINEGQWAFYEHANFEGEVLFLEPGTYNLTDEFSAFSPNGTWNDYISSLLRFG